MRDTKSNTPVADAGNALASDFRNVVTDAQELMRTIGSAGDAKLAEKLAEGRSSFDAMVKRLETLQQSVDANARTLARETDTYVHDNPWGAIGIAAGVGVVVGFLLARR